MSDRLPDGLHIQIEREDDDTVRLSFEPLGGAHDGGEFAVLMEPERWYDFAREVARFTAGFG